MTSTLMVTRGKKRRKIEHSGKHRHGIHTQYVIIFREATFSVFTIKCPAGTVCMYFVMKEYKKEREEAPPGTTKFSFEGFVCRYPK
jgi:hypothetical protein